MDVEAFMGALFNAALVIMIVATMFSAGLATTLPALGKVFRNYWLLVMVLITALFIRPLVGWGLAAGFGLEEPAYILMLLLAACAGAPLGAKFVMMAKGDPTTGASLQVLVATIATFTFPLMANWMITTADLGEGVSLPVGELIATVALLQLLPFVVGVCVRHWTPQHAMDWRPIVTKVSGIALLLVIALALLGSWEAIIDLFGQMVMLAGVIFCLIMMVVGWFIAKGDKATRKASALIEPGSNAGPVFAAVAIGFDNDPGILGVTTVLIFLQIVVGAVVASYMGRRAKGDGEEEEGTPAEAPAEAPAA